MSGSEECDIGKYRAPSPGRERRAASAQSGGQFAKQFRRENERVRSAGHYVT